MGNKSAVGNRREVQREGRSGRGSGTKLLMKGGQPIGESSTERSRRGDRMLAKDQEVRTQGINLDTFHPTMKQKFIIDQVKRSTPLTIVDGLAGSGKTTTVIKAGLEMMRAGGKTKRIIFIKTPSESGDDKIGYLSGDANEKLEAHFQAMREIFYQFMSPEKLADEEAQGRIIFAVPNFLQGCTFKDALVIVDECQNLSPSTTKLILERSGEGTSVAVLGDSTQKYAHDFRDDGFRDLISRTTTVNPDSVRMPLDDSYVSYHKLNVGDIKRSGLAAYISNLYLDWVEGSEVTDIWQGRIAELGYQ